MMSLVLSEDAISKRQRRDEIIDSLCNLPGGCCGGAGLGWLGSQAGWRAGGIWEGVPQACLVWLEVGRQSMVIAILSCC
jgi:hypothetical protein